MRIKWRKIFFRLLGFELLAVELVRLLTRVMHSFKTEMRRELAAWAIKVAFVLLLLGIVHCALLFGLVAMALYVNGLLNSSYQGFLVVSGGCVTLLLLLWCLRYIVYWTGKKR
jgi:hypothetical protein